MLYNIKDTTFVEHIVSALEDDFTREVAANFLGYDKNLRAVEPLISALKDQNGRVRNVVRQALSDLTGKDFSEDSVGRQKWWEQNYEDLFLTNPT